MKPLMVLALLLTGCLAGPAEPEDTVYDMACPALPEEQHDSAGVDKRYYACVMDTLERAAR